VLIARRTAAKSAVNENGDDSELDTAVQQLVDHRVVKNRLRIAAPEH
jgi:hypothetical protein